MNQLTCTTGCNLADLSRVMCKNIGSNGADIIWECKTDDLPTNVKFGQLVVSCERYENSADPYILVGSCALKYGLENIKSSSQPVYTTHTSTYSYPSYSRTYHHNDTVDLSVAIFLLLVFFVVFYFLCTCGGPVNHHPRVYNPRPHYGGGYYDLWWPNTYWWSQPVVHHTTHTTTTHNVPTNSGTSSSNNPTTRTDYATSEDR